MGFKSHGSLRTELSVEGQAVIGSQHGTVQLSDRKNLKYEVRRYCEHRIVTPQSEKREKSIIGAPSLRRVPQGAPYFLVGLKQNTSREGASVSDGRDFARAAASGGAN